MRCEQIEHCLPLQCGNVSMTNLQVFNPIMYVAEHDSSVEVFPGNWHTIYTRMNRWSMSGVLDWVFEQLQALAEHARAHRSRLAGYHHREGASGRHRGFKKAGPQSIGKSRGG